MRQTACWTVMVYMAGDNNLSAAGESDLDEMRQVEDSENINVIVEFDNAGDLGSRRIRVRHQGRDEPAHALDEVDSGDPETLFRFVNWAVEAYPAKRYALVLWNHGGGWHPEALDRIAQRVGASGFGVREAVDRSASPLARVLFCTTLERVLSLPRPHDRAICSDDGSGNSLDILELDRVLGRVVERIGRPLDLLGMDACLMNTVEVAHQVRRHARFLVASEENEPCDGWPYHRVLGALARRPHSDGADLARVVVEQYVASYRDRDHAGNVTQCGLDLSRLDHLTGAMDTLADALAEVLGRERHRAASRVWRAQLASARFWHNTQWDLGHLCHNLADQGFEPAVNEATEAVERALSPGGHGPVVAEAHRGTRVSRCAGVSVYCVPPMMTVSRFYPELAFSHDHRWLTLLRAYHDAR